MKLTASHIRSNHDLASRLEGVMLEGPNAKGWLGNRLPSVRREILLALKDVDAEKAKALNCGVDANNWENNDRFYLEAIGIAVGHDPSGAKSSSPTSPSNSPNGTSKSPDSFGNCGRRR